MTVARIIPKRIRDQQDANLTLGAGTNGYAVIYNHATGNFEMAALEAVGVAAGLITAHVGLSNPHTQYTLASSFITHQALTTAHGISAYGATLVDDADATAARTTLGLGTMATAVEADYLLATGTRTGATSQRQVFTNGITGPSWRPASDSTSALQLQNAAGTAVVTVDTTNQTVQIGSGATFAALAPLSIRRTIVSGGHALAFTIEGSYTSGGPGHAFAMWLNPVLSPPTGNSAFFGYFGGIVNAATATTVTGYGLYVAASTKTGSGTVANQYGLFVLSPTIGSQNFSIVTTGLAPCVFGGDVSMAVGSTPTAAADIAASTAARASLRMRNGTWPTTPNDGDMWNDGALTFFATSAATNVIVDTLRLRRASTGTPAAGFGVGILTTLRSSTTANQDAGRLTWAWTDATHATRASRGQLTAFFTSTERPTITWGANSTVALLSFYDITTPIARQVLATGAARTVDDVITALQALGLVKQS